VRVSPHFRKRRNAQDGYVLAVIVVMLTLTLLAATAAIPYVITQIKREREDELIHRGRAYSAGIKRFYKRMGRYPISLKELEDTNHMRFIRKPYKDPMTKGGEWRLIHYGEAKFFPKGFGYNGISGLGGGTGGAILPGGMSNILSGSGQSSFQSTQQVTQGDQSNQPNTGGMTPADQISKPLGSGGPTLGNVPIIGVASTDKDASIHEVNERKRYDEWEFFYDPRFDIAMTVMPGAATQPVSGPGPGGSGPGQKR
jgi:type II secretory pathway pseudopilin PulG